MASEPVYFPHAVLCNWIRFGTYVAFPLCTMATRCFVFSDCVCRHCSPALEGLQRVVPLRPTNATGLCPVPNGIKRREKERRAREGKRSRLLCGGAGEGARLWLGAGCPRLGEQGRLAALPRQLEGLLGQGKGGWHAKR